MNQVSPYPVFRPPAGAPSEYSPLGQSSLPLADEINFKEYWRVAAKHRWLIGSLTLSAAILVIAWSFGHTPQYTAVSTIMIQPQAPQVLDELKDLVSEQSTTGDYDYYKTQFDILKSDTLIAHVIRDYGLEGGGLFPPKRREEGAFANLEESVWHYLNKLGYSLKVPPSASARAGEPDGIRPELIDSYKGHLSIDPVKGTRLVKISVTSSDAGLSARVADAHVQTYIRLEMELHAQTGKSVEDFLQQKLVDLKDRVESSEAALNKYRRDRGIVTLESGDVKNPDRSPLVQRMNEINTDLTEAQNRLMTLESEHQLIAEGSYDALPEVIANPVIQNLKEQTTQLYTDYASMSNRYNPGYHPLDDLKAKLDGVRQRLTAETAQVARSVDAQYNEALASESKLASELNDVKQQMLALNDASLQEAVLEREVEADRKLYESVVQRMDEIDVGAQTPNSNISIVDYAQPPRAPSGPGLLQLLLFACAGGAVTGVALAFFLESLDDTLHAGDDTNRYLGLPNLGVVPDFHKLNGHGYSAGRSTPSRKRLAQVAAAENNGAPKELVVTTGTFSTTAEVYRSIRTAIMFSRAGGAPKSILVTSSTANEGKTLTTINIAAAFAHTGNRTIIVDTDLRRSRVHEIFGIEPAKGLTEVLVRQYRLEEAIHPTKVPGLFLLCAGSLAPNPSELLASPEMRMLIQQLAKTYDYVLLDSAPIMPVSDTVGLATMVDAVLMVSGSNTARKLVRETCRRLVYVGAKILGVVLNRVDLENNSYQYYSYYDSYKPRKRQPVPGATIGQRIA